MHIDITDSESSERVVAAFCARFGYNDTVDDENGDDIPNPVSREEFAHDRICRWITSQVVKHESQSAIREAEQSARDSAGSLDLGG